MEDLIHADIFFFITSIVEIILAIFLIISGVYIVKILVDIKEISRIAREESRDLAEDVRMMRQEIHHELTTGSSMTVSIIRIFRALLRRRSRR